MDKLRIASNCARVESARSGRTARVFIFVPSKKLISLAIKQGDVCYARFKGLDKKM
jgi:hypothetical protein